MEMVLLCAGRGSRLGNVTDKKPKAMTEVHGIPIIKNTIKILNELKSNNIKIIVGYEHKKFPEFQGVKKIINKNWDKTNMVGSYFLSINKDSFRDTVFIYGDIIVNKNVIINYVDKLDKKVGSILIDNNWFDYWSMRSVNPLNDAETCIVDENDCLLELGKKINDDEIPKYQYTGIGFFPASYQKKIYVDWVSELSLTNEGRNFYMTDIINKLIKENYKFVVHKTSGKWLEIDTQTDLNLAYKLSKKTNENELTVLR